MPKSKVFEAIEITIQKKIARKERVSTKPTRFTGMSLEFLSFVSMGNLITG